MAGSTRAKVSVDRKLAEAAGYVDPFPAPGTANVITIDDRCPNCRRTLYVSALDRVWCPYEQCSAYRVRQEVCGEQPVPAP